MPPQRMLVYLGDLGHNVVTTTSDVYPLGVADLAAYADAYLKAADRVEFKLFRDPQELEQALDARSPDVLGLSSYSWNHYLSLEFARYAKAKDETVLTLMGGPNFPLTPPEQESWLRTMPEIDVAVRGPTYEGERAFLNVLQRYVDVGGSIDGLLEEAVPGNVWIDKTTGDLVRGEPVERIRDLDEIPSPYLAGYLDKFFDTGLFVLLQAARGCPFTCQFCNSAVTGNNKAFRHSFENVKADLDYVVSRVDSASPLCFADDNFGMYKPDEEIADYLGYLMERYDWPKYIRATTGKNQDQRIIRVMRKAKGRLPMTSSVQSLNPVVLENIKRSNISLQAYEQIHRELQRQGMQSYGELILCMPGETKASVMKAIDDMLAAGVHRVAAHQLMLLHGAPLSNPESREKFEFETRFRLVARCLGRYTEEKPVVETEEVVVETPTFSFEEYLETRVFHLLLTIYFYEANFQEAFELARQQGLSAFEIIEHLQSTLDSAPPAFRDAIRDYVTENEQELFDSRESCLVWAERHYEELIDGSVGGNLLSKYSMVGRFYVVREALDFLQSGIASLLNGEDREGRLSMLGAIMDYYRSVMLHVPFSETLGQEPAWTTAYDIERWREDKYGKPLEAYRFRRPRTFATQVAPRSKAVIEARIATWGEHPAGLGRFTRSLFAHDLRRRVVRPSERKRGRPELPSSRAQRRRTTDRAAGSGRA